MGKCGKNSDFWCFWGPLRCFWGPLRCLVLPLYWRPIGRCVLIDHRSHWPHKPSACPLTSPIIGYPAPFRRFSAFVAYASCYSALVILVFLISNAKRRNRRTILTKSESKSSSKTRGDNKKAAADAQPQRTCTDQGTKRPVSRPANCQSVDVWQPAVYFWVTQATDTVPPRQRPTAILACPATVNVSTDWQQVSVVNTLGELQWQAAAAS